MNNVYLRSKDNLKKIILKTVLALLPLIIAGFYKNGIKLYINGYVSFIQMFKPLFYDVVGILIGLLVNIIYDRIIKKNNNSIFNSFSPLYGLLIASVISINTNIFLFIGITFICLFISKLLPKSNINVIALTALLIIFISNLLGNFSFLNIYEQNNKLNLIALDYLIGRGSGGINTTHVLLLSLSLLVLWTIKSYKREIPIYSAIFYSACMIIYCTITNNVGYILENIFANGILFSFIFIAPDSLSSPYTSKGKIIFGILIGISTFGLFLLYPPLAALGGIVIVSMCHSTIDKIVLKTMKKGYNHYKNL